MHAAHADLLNKLFTALSERNHDKMASCYHPEAHFRDIAFNLRGREKIHDMWRMICTGESGIRVEFEIVEADDRKGRARVTDFYTFGAVKGDPKSGLPVVNAIDSHFEFEGDQIRHHHDHCDPKRWAEQALDDGTWKGRIMSYLAGRIRPARSIPAWIKLKRFVKANRKARRPG